MFLYIPNSYSYISSRARNFFLPAPLYRWTEDFTEFEHYLVTGFYSTIYLSEILTLINRAKTAWEKETPLLGVNHVNMV